jgi:plastocyanin domain-containing protein
VQFIQNSTIKLHNQSHIASSTTGILCQTARGLLLILIQKFCIFWIRKYIEFSVKTMNKLEEIKFTCQGAIIQQLIKQQTSKAIQSCDIEKSSVDAISMFHAL